MTIKNYKRALSALNKYYNKNARDAKKRDFRLDARGVRVPMTPAGLRADLKQNEQKRARAIAWLEKCNNAPALDSLLINVEWVKNRTWGNNPRAEVCVYNTAHEVERLSGSASGCGYDKRSAAVDSALVGSPVFGRFLIENWRRVWDCYGVSKWRGIPELDISGKGIDTLRDILEKCGFSWVGNWGKTWDCYNATPKKGRKNDR